MRSLPRTGVTAGISETTSLPRLSPNKAKRLRRLTSPDNTYLCARDPGLWNGMSLSSLNTVMALKCDEVSLTLSRRRLISDLGRR